MSSLNALSRLDATAQAELVRRGDVTGQELMEAFRARVEALEPHIHALTVCDFERGLARARMPSTGPFAGVPFLLKDVALYPGLRCSFGSRLFAQHVAPQGSPYTQRLDEAGLITVGKTTTSEFGLLGSTETLLEGVTHNPWQLEYSAAGSSGGAAAAVAAGMVPLAHASDGGGSIRIPASVCGLFGLKTSAWRCVPISFPENDFSRLLSEHCVSRSVRDSALLLSLTEVSDASAVHPPVGFVSSASRVRRRIGVYTRTLVGGEPVEEVRVALEDAVRLCRQLGHEVVEIAPPAIDGHALGEAFFAQAAAGLSSMMDMLAMLRGRPVKSDEVEPFTWSTLEHFREDAAVPLARAQSTFEQSAARYRSLFSAVELVLTPTLAVLPWKIGHLSPILDRETLMQRTREAVGYTPIHNIAGCPAMSVPLGWSRAGLPIGIHFAAAPGQERSLLELAYELEDATSWGSHWAPFSYPELNQAHAGTER